MVGMAAERARLTTEEIEMQEVTHHGKGPGRVLSVDMLRGITIALMILVNDPGDWSHTFSQLDHAKWSGWTMTDLVFPTFLFLMGASMVFSLSSRVAKGDCRWTLAGHIISRGFRIFLLAFVMVYLPRMQWHSMRFFGYGVLARIAISYVLAGLLLLISRRMVWMSAMVAVLLVGYWVLLRFVPVPGYGVPTHAIPLLDPVYNIVAYVDRAVVAWTQMWLHTGTLYGKGQDPEGLMSTLPAVASVLLGAMTGVWMRKLGKAHISATQMRLGLLLAGLVSFLAGEAWSHWLPINKNLWTSSFVLLTAGIAAMVLAICSWLVDTRHERWPLWLRVTTWPWFVYGANAIAAFVVSEALVKVMIFVRWVDSDGHGHTPWGWTYDHLFAIHGSNNWTSLAFAIAFVVVCFLPNWWLWHRRVFLKI
jgi:predicted acyltransferase